MTESKETKAEEAPDASAAPAQPPKQGAEVPAFAKDFPDDPELHTLCVAFEQGRYDVVRERAPRLAESAEDPEVARAAQELRRRLDADPLAVKLLLGVLALLVLLTAWSYLYHQH